MLGCELFSRDTISAGAMAAADKFATLCCHYLRGAARPASEPLPIGKKLDPGHRSAFFGGHKR